MDVKKLTTPQLWKAFREALAFTKQGLEKMAIYYAELQTRKEDLSGFTSPIFAYLPAIAAGKFDPELIVRFGSKPRLMTALSKIVPEDQRKVLASNGNVVVRQPDGSNANINILDLKSGEIDQVFGDGRMRNTAEQAKVIGKPAAPVISDKVVTVRFTAKEASYLEEALAGTGLTIEQYIRDLLMAAGSLPTPQPIKVKAHTRRNRAPTWAAGD